MSTNLQKKLNEYLANQQVSYIKLHNLHWYVKGLGFFTLHAKLEELYDQTAQIIDDVAERILALGGSPVGSFKKALELSRVEELSDAPIGTKETVEVLVNDVELWIRDSKELFELAEEAGDNVTADMFNEYVAEYQKLLWMLNAYRG